MIGAASLIGVDLFAASAAGASPTPLCGSAVCTVDFAQTGGAQDWVVPDGVATINVTVAAGSGGASAFGAGGVGGQVAATLPVLEGENITVIVGAAGTKGTLGGTGGYGGGGPAGTPAGSIGGGGGGGSFLFDTSTGNAVLLAAAGGGGGAGNDPSGIPGAGGGNDAGTDATYPPDPVVAGVGGTLTTGGTGGGGSSDPGSIGFPGSGPATDPQTLGDGGNGGHSTMVPMASSAGGGGGGFFGGGGGGVAGTSAQFAGPGGGGSGFLEPAATGVSTSTNLGDGSVQISYALPVSTTTSGMLRDAATGDPIPDACVVFSPSAFPGRTNYTSVGGDGSWSFDTDEFGPFNLAFYTTANGDCSQPILATPVPSWYVNQPLTGTDEHVITPPAGSTTVAAGASNVVACLGASALPTAACVVPHGVMSGTVDTTGPVALADVCVVALNGQGNGVGVAVTDANGNWAMTGLPNGLGVVVVFLPGASDPNSPCNSNNNGPPPVPGVGQLQPVFYNNIWVNLADPTLLNDAYGWALAHGATLLTPNATGIITCITTAPGTVTPRPLCGLTFTAADTQTLPNTGAAISPLLTSGTSLTLLGTLILWLTTRRRCAKHSG